jgi:hypothetical protein
VSSEPLSVIRVIAPLVPQQGEVRLTGKRPEALGPMRERLVELTRTSVDDRQVAMRIRIPWLDLQRRLVGVNPFIMLADGNQAVAEVVPCFRETPIRLDGLQVALRGISLPSHLIEHVAKVEEGFRI